MSKNTYVSNAPIYVDGYEKFTLTEVIAIEAVDLEGGIVKGDATLIDEHEMEAESGEWNEKYDELITIDGPYGGMVIDGTEGDATPIEEHEMEAESGEWNEKYDEPITIDGPYGGIRVEGAEGDDIIIGTKGMDTLWGDDGDDSIFGGGENDTIFGGKGDDTIFGGEGWDEIYGGGGDDRLSGGEGINFIYGEAGDDTFVYDGDSAGFYSGGSQSETLGLGDVLLVEGSGEFVTLDDGDSNYEGIEILDISGKGDNTLNLSAFDAADRLEALTDTDSFIVKGDEGDTVLLGAEQFMADGQLDISGEAYIHYVGGSGADGSTVDLYINNSVTVTVV
ncbi:MAG: calcium-binding protein [Coxiellaceae bacterium]|nr:calcium-binding protein [Coxiellaceae bacterium]